MNDSTTAEKWTAIIDEPQSWIMAYLRDWSGVEIAYGPKNAMKAIADAHNATVERLQEELHEQAGTILQGMISVQSLRTRLQKCEEALRPIDDLYVQFKQVESSAIWGGSFEREHGARMELKPLVNQLFDAMLKIMAERNPTSIDGKRIPLAQPDKGQP